MNTDVISGYIGQFKQPIQKPETYTPTMYVLSDSLKTEVDLVLLTPGSLLHAYKYLSILNAQQVRIFTPSLRYEFVSDVFNLFMLEKEVRPTKWVFPDEVDHYTFSNGQIKAYFYINEYDANITISYIENENVDNVYDIIIRDGISCEYFCQYLEEDMVDTLYENDDITHIHVSNQSTLYGGLTYQEIISIDNKYRSKFVPHSFLSIDEYEKYMEDHKLAKGKVIYNDFI